MIPQVHQRREQIVAHAAAPRACRRRPAPRRRRARGSRSFSSSTMRSDVFLPTPGMAVSRARSPRSIARTSSGGSMPGQHRERELRADAADADQPLEQLLLERRREAVERQRILAHVRVNAQRDLAAGLAEPVERRQRERRRRSRRRRRRRRSGSDASRGSGRADARSRPVVAPAGRRVRRALAGGRATARDARRRPARARDRWRRPARRPRRAATAPPPGRAAASPSAAPAASPRGRSRRPRA